MPEIVSTVSLGTDPIRLCGATLLERYRIEELIACGGMSLVYRGLDLRLQRMVCVKVLYGLNPLGAAYQVGRDHFVQEAFALSQLQHPSIVQVYDYGQLDSAPPSPFYVCELLRGGTLRALVDNGGAMAPPEALDAIASIAGALSAAHERGIVHRDVKPCNVFISEAGFRRTFKLGDFGIAKASSDAIPHRAPATQAVAGNGPYLFSSGWAAPEQFMGGEVSPRTDVYGLGILTAYVLTGRRVFEDRRGVARTDAELRSALGRIGVHGRLFGVIETACRASPAERYPSARDFLTALMDALEPDGEVRAQHFDSLPDPGPNTVVLPLRLPKQITVAGRCVRLLEASPYADVTFSHLQQDALRVRVTLLPVSAGHVSVHVKGLSCFVRRADGGLTSAVAFHAPATLELLAPRSNASAAVYCTFGRGNASSHTFQIDNGTLVVPRALCAMTVMFDTGIDSDLVLVHSTPKNKRSPK